MTPSINTSMGLREWVMLVTLSVLWGGSFFFVGVVVMIGTPVMGEGDSTLAQVAIMVAALSYAFAGVYGRRFKKMLISPFVAAAGQVTASALVMAPIALITDGPLNIAEPSAGGLGIYCRACCSINGCCLRSIFQVTGVSRSH
jgi:drug/metabolite transporter (DMT)-like permease